jgi:hypothetical protein
MTALVPLLRKAIELEVVITTAVNGRTNKATIEVFDKAKVVQASDRADLREFSAIARVAKNLIKQLQRKGWGEPYTVEWAIGEIEKHWHEGRTEYRRQAENPEPPHPQDDPRPEILIVADVHVMVEQALHLLRADPTVYQRNAVLVRLVRDSAPEGVDPARKCFRIDALPKPSLAEHLSMVARWEKITNEGVEMTIPPNWCVAALDARGFWPGIRHMEGVVNHPMLRADGTVVSAPGYDLATGLFVEMTEAFPSIPEYPSQAEANIACARLLEIVADFPFEGDKCRAAWLGALLTPLARLAFVGPAPMFLADANVRGAGKTLLMNLISHIITGKPFARAALTDDDEELNKTIVALMMASARLVLFDNLEGDLGGAVLNGVLTAETWAGRLLGFNKIVEGPLLMTWYGTANNVTAVGDITRRICDIRLESPEERPEERAQFVHEDLLAWVLEHRREYLADALTILRGYFAAGCPRQELPPWGSFGGWTNIVRGALVWAGQTDPGEARMVRSESGDPIAECMTMLLACWGEMEKAVGKQGLTTAEVVQLYKDPFAFSPPKMPAEAPVLTFPAWHAELVAALDSLVGKVSAGGLGRKLTGYRRRNFDGRFIDRVGKAHHAIRWHVASVADFFKRHEKFNREDSPGEATSGAGEFVERPSPTNSPNSPIHGSFGPNSPPNSPDGCVC